MTVLVTSLKNKKDVSSANACVTSGPKTTKLTKLAKVPSWTKDMSLETYLKHIVT